MRRAGSSPTTACTALDSSGMPAEQRELLRRLLESAQGLNRAQDAAGVATPRPGLSVPFDGAREAAAGDTRRPYNGYGHAFAGMSVQFALFAAIELAVGHPARAPARAVEAAAQRAAVAHDAAAGQGDQRHHPHADDAARVASSSRASCSACRSRSLPGFLAVAIASAIMAVHVRPAARRASAARPKPRGASPSSWSSSR